MVDKSSENQGTLIKLLPLYCHKIEFEDPFAVYLVFGYDFYQTAVGKMEIFGKVYWTIGKIFS